jgi:hypothetical protein
MEIRGNRLAYYDSFSERDLEPDRRRGKADGLDCFPPADTNRFHYSEQEIISRVRADLSEFMQEVHERRAAYEEERDAKIQRVETHNARRDVQILEYKSRLEALRRLKGDGSPLFQQAKDSFDDAQDAMRTKTDDMARPVSIHLHNRLYYGIFGLLAFAEVPINWPAIEQVFRESRVLSALLAVVLGVVLIVIAHIMGRLLRQWQHAKASGYGFIHFLFIALSLLVSGTMVYLLYELRVRYMTSDVGGIFGGNATDMMQGGQLFLAFNLAIVLVGTMVAFAHHDPDPDYQTAHENFRRAKKIFDALKEAYEQDRHKLQRQFDLRAASTGREVERLQAEVEVTRKSLANLERQKLAFIDRVLHVMRLRLAAYQAANQRSRAMTNCPGIPRYFGDEAIEKEAAKMREEFGDFFGGGDDGRIYGSPEARITGIRGPQRPEPSPRPAVPADVEANEFDGV